MMKSQEWPKFIDDTQTTNTEHHVYAIPIAVDMLEAFPDSKNSPSQ